MVNSQVTSIESYGAASLTLAERCRGIDLLIVDVDGVLTDGGIVYTDHGVELKHFHVRDGSGVKLWQQAGKQAAILTGRTSPLVEVRAAEIGITTVIQGAADKWAAYLDLLAQGPWQPRQVCYLGDDIPDLPVLHNCGLAVAVADACPEVLIQAHYVTRRLGGRGAVRETIELLLNCQGYWQTIIDRYNGQSL